jgi:hypothetical protein
MIDSDIAHLIRNYSSIMLNSNIADLHSTDDDYFLEKQRIEKITDMCAKYAFEPLIFNIPEIDHMHHYALRLNYNDYSTINT